MQFLEYENDVFEEETGSCDLCMFTFMQEHPCVTLRDENNKKTSIELYDEDYDCYDHYFSTWRSISNMTSEEERAEYIKELVESSKTVKEFIRKAKLPRKENNA